MSKYTVDFGEQLDRTIERLAKEKGTTKADVLRRAIASYDYLVQQVNPTTGMKIAVSDGNDRVVKEVVLP